MTTPLCKLHKNNFKYNFIFSRLFRNKQKKNINIFMVIYFTLLMFQNFSERGKAEFIELAVLSFTHLSFT